MPTVFEVVSERKPIKDKPTAAESGSKPKASTKVRLLLKKKINFRNPRVKWSFSFVHTVYLQRSSDGQVKSIQNQKVAEESYEDEEDEHGDTQCGSCGGNYNADEFWIGCDICERWYHGKCVKITPAKAESIKQYKCPSCTMKRARP